MHSYHAPLRLIGLAAFTSMASMRICDPMLLAMAAEFQASPGEAAAAVSAFALAYGVMQLFYGPMGDRLGKVRVIVAATYGCALCSALTSVATSLPWLIAARTAAGALAAGVIPLSIAWVGDQVAYDRRQETLARLMGATLSGMMAGQWFGGLAAQSLGWRSAFIVLCVLFLLAATVLHRYSRHAPASERPAPAAAAFSLQGYAVQLFGILRLPRVRLVLVATALEGALAYGTLAFFPSRLVQAYGFSVAVAGGVMILFGVGGLCYALWARHWLRRLGEKGLARLGGVLYALCLTALAWSEHAPLAVASCFLAGLGLYMLHNTLQTQATQMAPQARGTAVTLFACTLFLGTALGVGLAARAMDGGLLGPAFTAAAAGLVLLGAWISGHVQGRAATPG